MVITSGLTNAASANTASDIQLGSCVTEIGQGAFSGYSNITEIEFPDALTTIGNYAFQNCDNLSAVTIHSGITSIGSSAFTYCDSLEKITFESNTPIALGNIRPFGGESGYPLYVPFESYDSYVSAWSYYKNRITYEGMPYMAKIYAEDTEQVSFIPCSPSSTTIIYAKPIVSAFTNPIVEFGDCVTRIGGGAFSGNNGSFKEIKFSSGITSIGDQAFCAINVANIDLHLDYLETIGYRAFSNSYFNSSSPSGCTLYLSDKINNIGDGAFSGSSGITDIHVVGNSATTYGRRAFFDRYSWDDSGRDIYNTFVLDNTNEIASGQAIFSSAHTVTLNNVKRLGRASIGVPFNKLTINGEGAIIGDGSGTIFAGLTGRTTDPYELVLGEGVTTIGASAFCNSNIGGTIVIPNTVTTIGGVAFNFTGSKSYQDYTGLTIGSGVTSIGNAAFYTYYLKELTLVDGLRRIDGDYAWGFGSPNLTSVTLSNTLEEIPIGFLSGSTNLSSITIPNSVTSIGDAAFSRCSKLSNVTIPSGVTSIGNTVFYNCSGFTNITIHDNITSVGNYAFANCASVTSLYLGSSLRTIVSRAFMGCKKLSTLTIPNNIVSIGDAAFSGCTSLGSIVINRPTPPVLGSRAFDSTNDCTIFVPQESYELYINAEGWSAYRDRIWSTNVDYKALLISDGSNSVIHCSSSNTTLAPIPRNNATTIMVGNCVTTISANCFVGSTLVENITLSDSVATIGDNAFANLQNLETVNFGSGVTSIGSCAFGNCTNITNINLQSGVTSIGGAAFSGCTSLTNINLPDSVTSIGSNLFSGCSGLTSIRIPSGVTYLPNNLFEGCTSLETVYVPSNVNQFDYSTFNDIYSDERLALDIYFERLTPVTNGLYNATFNASQRLFVPCISYNSYKEAYSSYRISYYPDIYLSDLLYKYGKEEYDEYRWDGEAYICEDGNKYKQLEKYVSWDGETYYATGFYSLGDLLEADSYYCAPKAVFSIGSDETHIIYCNDSNALERAETSGYSSSATSVVIGSCVTELRDTVFYTFSHLSGITIPNSVIYIGRDAFYYTSNFPITNNIYYADTIALKTSDNGLTEYTVKEGTRFINDKCFYGCNNLTTVNLPNSLCGIGQMAFVNCNHLTNVTIPSGVTYIGNTNVNSDNGAFENCYNLTNCTFAENSQLKIISAYTFSYCRSLTSIDIPNGVTTIGDYAFQECNSLSSITIPDSVTSLGIHAFYQCSGATSVTIGSGVTTIGNAAFCFSYGLTSLNIPNSVTSIGSRAFSYCRSLITCTIGSAITSIGDNAFYLCSGLTSITILATTPPVINQYTFYGTNDCPIFVPCESVSAYQQSWSGVSTNAASRIVGIPPCDAVPNAKLYATYRNGGTKLVPCGSSSDTLKTGDTRVTVAPSDSYLTMLTANVGDCVRTISGSAFSGCSQLSSVTLSDNITTIGTYLFSSCRNLVSCNIPSGLTSIPNYTFTLCDRLNNITIPSNIRTIGTQAFRSCSGLTNIDILDSVTSIGDSAFSGCTSLSSCTIGSGITSIGQSVFSNCYSLTSIDIPNSVTTIDKWAFTYCTSLTSIDIPDSVTTINTSAFRYCTSLTSCTIGSGVTSIGEYVFYGCSGLTSIDIPNGVTTIGNYAFQGCSRSLSSITVDSNNSVYDSRNNCNAIIKTSTNELILGCENTVMSNTVTAIGASAFRDCSGITSCTIGSGVTSISEYAFYNCSNLLSITVLAETPPTLGTDAFIGTNSCPIYVPQDSLALYQAADYWSSYGTRIQPIPNT